MVVVEVRVWGGSKSVQRYIESNVICEKMYWKWMVWDGLQTDNWTFSIHICSLFLIWYRTGQPDELAAGMDGHMGDWLTYAQLKNYLTTIRIIVSQQTFLHFWPEAASHPGHWFSFSEVCLWWLDLNWILAFLFDSLESFPLFQISLD